MGSGSDSGHPFWIFDLLRRPAHGCFSNANTVFQSCFMSTTNSTSLWGLRPGPGRVCRNAIAGRRRIRVRRRCNGGPATPNRRTFARRRVFEHLIVAVRVAERHDWPAAADADLEIATGLPALSSKKSTSRLDYQDRLPLPKIPYFVLNELPITCSGGNTIHLFR